MRTEDSDASLVALQAAVLLGDGHAGEVYELAGDEAWSHADLATEIGRQAGRAVAYRNLPQGAFADARAADDLPATAAALFADADARAADGALFDDGHAPSRLIGRPTTPVPETIAAALRG